MADVVIDIEPNAFVFETLMRVRHNEIDSGQHLTIEALVNLFSESRARFLFARGIAPINEQSQGIIIIDMITNLLNRARVREELLFEVGVQNLHTNGGEFVFQVSTMNDRLLVANAIMSFVMYDFSQNKVVALPASLKQILTEFGV